MIAGEVLLADPLDTPKFIRRCSALESDIDRARRLARLPLGHRWRSLRHGGHNQPSLVATIRALHAAKRWAS